MKKLDPRIEPLLARMASDGEAPRGAEEIIRNAIAESPYLTKLIGNAAEDRIIGRIAVSHGESNGGHFEAGKKGEPGTLYVSESTFRLFTGEARMNALTEVLGHEGMHGVLTKTREEALDKFTSTYREAMQGAYSRGDATVDLTDPLRSQLEYARKDEALAEISAIRSLNSRIQHLHPNATDSEVEKALSTNSNSRCARNAVAPNLFANGITYNAINNVSEGGPSLTRAVEKCFFDGPATLGKHGDSDYPNYYGVGLIERIASDYGYLAQGRQPPEIRVDFKELGLDPKQIERNGVNLGGLKVLPLVDMGKDGFGWVQLKHTAEQTESRNQSPNRALSDRTPDHTHHLSPTDTALLDQIRGKVAELDKANGRTFDQTSERISASLLATAKDAGITRADHVLLSAPTATLPGAHNVFVVQGDPANPAHLRAQMPTAEAAQRPVQESLGQVEAIGQRQSQEQATERQQEQDRQHRNAGPSL